MEEQLSKLAEKLTTVLETQAEIKADLREHMRRTELAEEGIEKLAEAIRPIQNHVALVRGTGSLVAWVLGIITAIATTYAALK